MQLFCLWVLRLLFSKLQVMGQMSHGLEYWTWWVLLRAEPFVWISIVFTVCECWKRSKKATFWVLCICTWKNAKFSTEIKVKRQKLCKIWLCHVIVCFVFFQELFTAWKLTLKQRRCGNLCKNGQVYAFLEKWLIQLFPTIIFILQYSSSS